MHGRGRILSGDQNTPPARHGAAPVRDAGYLFSRTIKLRILELAPVTDATPPCSAPQHLLTPLHSHIMSLSPTVQDPGTPQDLETPFSEKDIHDPTPTLAEPPLRRIKTRDGDLDAVWLSTYTGERGEITDKQNRRVLRKVS